MLEPEMKAQLGAYLERLVTPVEITAYVDDSTESRDMLGLLADIASLTPRVTFTPTREGAARTPSLRWFHKPLTKWLRHSWTFRPFRFSSP